MIAVAKPESSAPVTEAAFTAAFLGEPHRWIDRGYARVATWSFGQGPDVLFVHGWPLWSATFRRIAPMLARDFRLHFFDLPGAGRSVTQDLKRVNLKDHIETTQAVVRELELRRYAIVAHDSGGAIARVAIAQDPQVFALVLGNTELANHVPWQVALFTVLAKLGLSSLLTASLKIGPIRRSSLIFGGCFQDARYADGEFGELMLAGLKRPGGFGGQMAFAKNMNPKHIGDLAKAHQAIRCPTLCIWGTDDPFFPIKGARAMLDGFGGGAKLLELEGAKLFAHEDRAAEFGAATLAFLKERC